MSVPSARRPLHMFEPDLGDAEEQAVVAVLRSGWVAMGPKVEAFEERFAALTGSGHAVAVGSCTAALHLTNLALDIGPGDDVIVPSLTFAATANAVHMTGATPVFADVVGPDDWTISADDVARKLTDRTRAVIAMHYAGHAADMDRLAAVCQKADVDLIEDACHGLGGQLGDRALGAIGRAGCFSFYSNKLITTGEGGMVTTDDQALAERIKRLRSHGMTATAIDRVRGAMIYDVTEPGLNYRLDDLRAALGLAQLDRINDKLARRHELVARYESRLAVMDGVATPDCGRRGRSAHYLMPVRLTQADRDAVRRRLQADGIQTSVHYRPVHQFAHYRDQATPLPLTEDIGAKTLSLPLYPSMTLDQVDRVCDALAEAAG